MKRRTRSLLVGAAATAAGLAAAVAAERASVRRMRARLDPEAEEPLGLLPPEDLGPVRSFDGTELAVRAAGPEGAPVLLFTHGIVLDMTTWHYQWRSFSDRYRCVLFDHRAHGRSGRPPAGDHSVEALGRDLRAVLNAAAPEGPVVLVGHSMGGMAIVSLAERHPELFGDRVAGVVLADTAVSDLVREFLGVAGAGVERRIRPLLDRLVSDPARAERVQTGVRRWGRDLAFLAARLSQFGPDASPSQVDHVTRIATGVHVDVWTQMLGGLLEMDLRHALEHVVCPALVVVGDRDLVTPKTSAVAIRDALPDARAVVVTRAGHLSMMEQHGIFNGLLEEFLGRVLAREEAAG